ncbi:retrovirus-related pol polyprotein from transposon TNT 1-94 [Tanacetum coccineum]
MHALLVQHGCETALEVLPVDMEAEAKAELNKKAYSIPEHIDEFNKIILYLENIKGKFEDDFALLLLTSSPASYEHFVDTFIYGQEALTLEDVMATLNSKEIKERSKAKGVMIMMSVEALLDWIMDSGRSYHMTPMLDLFFDFLECDGGRVLLGDNRKCKIKCIGKWQVSLFLVLKKKTILSRFGTKGCISEAGLQVLEKHDLFSKKSLDLWGPSQVESLGGKSYFLSIIDDYSKRVWVYILSFKHDAFGKFK